MSINRLERVKDYSASDIKTFGIKTKNHFISQAILYKKYDILKHLIDAVNKDRQSMEVKWPIQAANATLPCLKNISAGVL